MLFSACFRPWPTRARLNLMRGLALFVMTVVAARAQEALPTPREVINGITTTRIVQGEPYELAGKRVIFTNWYYVQPGDLDWRDAAGKSVYVHGDSGAFDAQHVGIDAPQGIRIRAEKPTVIGPMTIPHRSILRDGDVFRGWTDNEYYESVDGLKWEKKANLTFNGPMDDGVWHVFIDHAAPAAERFKTVWVGRITRAEFEAFRKKRPDGWEPRALLHAGEKDEVSCVRGSVSPDGVNWTTLPDPLVVEYCDSLNTCYYDPVLRKYVLYTRYWSVGPQSLRVPVNIRNSWTHVGRRAIGRSESADFRSFPPSEMVLDTAPDMLPSETLYTNCRTTIPGAPDQHLMFPAIWNAAIDDTTRIGMASSSDGKLWQWVPGGDVLRTQLFGQWNGGCIWVLPNLIELPNGDWALPYLAHNFPHKYPRGQQKGGTGYAVWPKGRMVALEAAEEGGFTMISIIAPGRTLKINALTSRTGWIKVEVVGVDGHSLADCVPIIGDQPWKQVTWKASEDIGVDAGRPITLRFQLSHAKLFGVEFE